MAQLVQLSSCWTRGERFFTRYDAPSHYTRLLHKIQSLPYYTKLFSHYTKLIFNPVWSTCYFLNFVPKLLHIIQTSFMLYKASSHYTGRHSHSIEPLHNVRSSLVLYKASLHYTKGLHKIQSFYIIQSPFTWYKASFSTRGAWHTIPVYFERDCDTLLWSIWCCMCVMVVHGWLKWLQATAFALHEERVPV